MLGRELDTVAHVGAARSRIKEVALRSRSFLFIKQKKRPVSVYWIRGRSEEALGTTVNPNDETSNLCHCRLSVGERLEERPGSLGRGRSIRNTISKRSGGRHL